MINEIHIRDIDFDESEILFSDDDQEHVDRCEANDIDSSDSFEESAIRFPSGLKARLSPISPSVHYINGSTDVSNKFSNQSDSKWRNKYLNALRISGYERRHSLGRIPEQRSINCMSTSSPMDIPRRSAVSSAPHSSPIAINKSPAQSPSNEFFEEDFEDADSPVDFIPPHQMIERGCFSLGLQHQFRHRVGKI